MIRRESRYTCTNNKSDIAIQATDDSNSDGEKQQEELYDFKEPFLFSDMVLLVDDEKLHCHRAILSLYSPVFRAMFQSKFEETSTNQVALPKDDAETVRELLKHLYTPGGCDMDTAAAQRLLPLIHRFQIDSLVTTAERTLSYSMTDTMGPKMLALADMYQLNTLKKYAIEACTRLDMKRMAEALEETPLSAELRAAVFEKRVIFLEQAITDIERSFSQSCVRMESKFERVFANHCQLHSKPLSTTTVPVSLQLTNPTTTTTTAAAAAETNNGMRLTTRVLQSNASDIDVSRGGGDEGEEEEGATASNTTTTTTTTLVEVPTVCEACVERISTHIKDLCRKALHKAQFVPYRPPNTVVTAASTPNH